MEQREYISREAAIETAVDYRIDVIENEYDRGYQIAVQDIAKGLNAIPAADVRPVVRGKWEAGGMFDDIGRCSCCHYMFPLDTAMTEFHFCPNCGADMRELNERLHNQGRGEEKALRHL